ncbi:MAG: histidine kinase dimerization/phospho-acceptor domain-containing protein [Rhodospirillales bacterium]
MTAAVFAAVGVLTGSLAGRARAEARAAGGRVAGLRPHHYLQRKLNAPATEPTCWPKLPRLAGVGRRRALVLTGDDTELMIAATEPATETPRRGRLGRGRWAFQHGEPTGAGQQHAALDRVAVHAATDRAWPAGRARGCAATWSWTRPSCKPWKRWSTNRGGAGAVRLAADAARAAASEDTQRLRTALLASLGHDLRTPLAGIQGAAGTLRTAWDSLTPETRADLLASIEQDVGRMARFLAHITDLTRLESGQIRPRLTAVPVAEVVEAAIARLTDPLHVTTFVTPGIIVRADAALLEQVLFNVPGQRGEILAAWRLRARCAPRRWAAMS